MSNQMALTLSAATIGLVAAIFFCIGNAFNSTTQIAAQATPYWDFSEPLARSLAAQRAQYVTGAILLFSFVLQVAATQASNATFVPPLRFIQSWPILVFAVLISISLIAGTCSYLLYRSTIKKVIEIGKGP